MNAPDVKTDIAMFRVKKLNECTMAITCTGVGNLSTNYTVLLFQLARVFELRSCDIMILFLLDSNLGRIPQRESANILRGMDRIQYT